MNSFFFSPTIRILAKDFLLAGPSVPTLPSHTNWCWRAQVENDGFHTFHSSNGWELVSWYLWYKAVLKSTWKPYLPARSYLSAVESRVLFYATVLYIGSEANLGITPHSAVVFSGCGLAATWLCHRESEPRGGKRARQPAPPCNSQPPDGGQF